MSYDFSRFTPQSFERFSQALIAHTFGPGVQIFGAGPDGAREATYEGQLDIQTQGKKWDGYTVVQAKFRSRQDRGGDDSKWLLQSLRADPGSS